MNGCIPMSPDVRISGGPSTGLTRYGTPEDVEAEAKRILMSCVMERSKCFILWEDNALVSGTPVENVNTIYAAAEKYGYYPMK